MNIYIYEYMISMNIIYDQILWPPREEKKKIEKCFHDGKDPASAFPGVQPFYHSRGLLWIYQIWVSKKKKGFQVRKYTNLGFYTSKTPKKKNDLGPRDGRRPRHVAGLEARAQRRIQRIAGEGRRRHPQSHHLRRWGLGLGLTPGTHGGPGSGWTVVRWG